MDDEDFDATVIALGDLVRDRHSLPVTQRYPRMKGSSR